MNKVLYKINSPGRRIAFNYIFGHINTRKQSTNDAWYISNKRAHHAIFHIEAPSATIELDDGKSYTFSKGNLIYLPKDSSYKIIFHGIDGCSTYAEQINYLAYDMNGNEYFLSFTPLLLLENAPAEIVDKMNSICRLTLSLSKPKYPISALFYDILDDIAQITSQSETSSSKKRCVSEALVYINEHLDESYPISLLTELTGTSESHLRKLFKEETGLTPIEYKNKQKINKVIDLLKLNPQITTLSLIDVFDFYDQSYFYKVFKKHTSIPFSEFRKTLIGKSKQNID